jgi:general secretion pathway protein G
MVVVVILGILAGVVAVNVAGHADTAKREAARAEIKAFQQALSLYQMDTGQYPSTAQGLKALVKDPGVSGWKEGGYLTSASVPKDPWENRYVYIRDGHGGSPDIISYGRDGREGGAGPDADIKSWALDAGE